MTDALLYRELFRLTYEDDRPPRERLHDAVQRIHAARPRHQFTGVYLLRGQMLELGAFAGPATDHTRIPVGRGLCGKAVTTRSDLDVADVNAQPEYLACSLTTKSEAIALIWHRGDIVGQIDIDSDTAGEFGASAMGSLRIMADILAPLVASA